MLIARGEARSPVMRQGVIIRNIETNTITPAIKVVSSACALDAIMTDGRTTKEALTMILMRHRALDSYYKEVALGNTRQPAGLESDMQALYDEIRDNYSPHATASCK